MKQPYTAGQALVWLEPDVEGIRVHRATVLKIEPTEHPERWRVSTERGEATVNSNGESARALPIDSEIATDLYIRGDGYLVRPTLTDEVHIARQTTHELDLDIDMDLGDDLGFD